MNDEHYEKNIEKDVFFQLRKKQLKSNGNDQDKFDSLFSGYKSRIETEDYFRKTILDPILNIMVDDELSHVDGIKFSFIQSKHFDAWTMKDSQNKRVIGMNSELPSVLSFYNEYSQIYNVMDAINDSKTNFGRKFRGDLSESINKSMGEEIEYLFGKINGTKDTIKCYLYILSVTVVKFSFDAIVGKRNRNYPILPIKLSSRLLHYSIGHTVSWELFIIAHELAHNVLGHVGKISRQKIGRWPKKKHKKHANHFVLKFNWQQECEIEADKKAFEFLTRLNISHSNPEINLTVLSPVFALDCLLFLDVFESYFGYPGEYSTHPPSLQRASEIFNSFKGKLSKIDLEYFSGKLQCFQKYSGGFQRFHILGMKEVSDKIGKHSEVFYDDLISLIDHVGQSTDIKVSSSDYDKIMSERGFSMPEFISPPNTI